MKLTIKNSLAATLALAGTATLAPVAGAIVVYDETFETYPVGDSNGQGLWVDYAGPQPVNVVNTIANSGTQSLEFSTSPGYGSDTTIDLAAPITSGQLLLTFDIFQPTGYDGNAHIFLSRGPTRGGIFEEGMHLVGVGTAGIFLDSGSPTTPLLIDQWVPVVVNIDLDADTATASYGGTQIFNGAWSNGGAAPNQFQGVNIWADEGVNTASFNIDNLRLEVIPEPPVSTVSKRIEIMAVEGPAVSLSLTIPEDVPRARVTRSNGLGSWELTQALPTDGGEWMERPEEGWGGSREVVLQLLSVEPRLFLRLEVGEAPFMEYVTVGNPGNEPDRSSVLWRGAVSYEYKIGKYEVTNAQYAVFLNAVAATDTYGLYNENMGTSTRSGIIRSGESGSYTYTATDQMGNKPVSYVSWYDAVRFCNWLHNGRASGPQDNNTTEEGAYTLIGASSVLEGRNEGARFHLPSRSEWYKAAFHEPGASTDDYWLYPTRSDSAPTVATADPFGNINNAGANVANYSKGADWNGEDGNVTTVGSAGPQSESFYGAADMAGNVWEWNEQKAPVTGAREWWGGSWANSSNSLQSLDNAALSEDAELSLTGLRVVAR